MPHDVESLAMLSRTQRRSTGTGPRPPPPSPPAPSPMPPPPSPPPPQRTHFDAAVDFILDRLFPFATPKVLASEEYQDTVLKVRAFMNMHALNEDAAVVPAGGESAKQKTKKIVSFAELTDAGSTEESFVTAPEPDEDEDELEREEDVQGVDDGEETEWEEDEEDLFEDALETWDLDDEEPMGDLDVRSGEGSGSEGPGSEGSDSSAAIDDLSLQAEALSVQDTDEPAPSLGGSQTSASSISDESSIASPPSTRSFPYASDPDHPARFPAGQIVIPWETRSKGIEYIAAYPILHRETRSLLPRVDWSRPCSHVPHACIACRHALLMYNMGKLHKLTSGLSKLPRKLTQPGQPGLIPTLPGPLRALIFGGYGGFKGLEPLLSTWRDRAQGTPTIHIRDFRLALARHVKLQRTLMQRIQADVQKTARRAQTTQYTLQSCLQSLEQLTQWVEAAKAAAAVHGEELRWKMHAGKMEALKDVLRSVIFRFDGYLVRVRQEKGLVDGWCKEGPQVGKWAGMAREYEDADVDLDVPVANIVEDLEGEVKNWVVIGARLEERVEDGKRLFEAAMEQIRMEGEQ
jgi:hypothetical protein